MKDNIIDILTQDFNHYLDCSLRGLTKKVDVYEIDFTRGETDMATLLCLDKNGLTETEALITLIQQALIIAEEWKDFESFHEKDIINFTNFFLRKYYNNSQYFTSISLEEDEDSYFVFDKVRCIPCKTISFNSAEISLNEFLTINPLMNEKIYKVNKSQFNKCLQCEFYIETDKHFLLYNWYTTLWFPVHIPIKDLL